MAVDQVTTTINTARSAVHGDDTVVAARLASGDAVRFLHALVLDDGAVLAQRTRAAVSILEVAGFLGGVFSAETRPSISLREHPDRNGASRDAA